MTKVLSERLKQEKFKSISEEALLNLFIAADSLRRTRESICSEFKITPNQYNILRILNGVYPNGHPRCDIINRMLEFAPDVTRLIDKLENLGFAERTRSSTDKRHSITRITPKGRKLLEKISPKMDELSRQLSKKLSSRESAKLSELCEKIYS